MSENSKDRYFRHQDGGVQAVDEASAMRLNGREEWTEVQVVPVDAIVIHRDELPKASGPAEHARGSNGIEVAGNVSGFTSDSVDLHRAIAIRHLAVAEYLREHPQVDEAQVKALAELVGQYAGESNVGQYTLARRLVERGVRVEQP